MTFRLLIEYDGSHFQGWQRQSNGISIQETLETTVQKLVGYPVHVYGASRTDSGVHARGQVAHFRLKKGNPIPPERWRRAINYYLPRYLRVREIDVVDDSFNAQKNVVSKIYSYRIINGQVGSALDTRVLHHPRRLDWPAIQAAMPYFVGTHDFKSFQGAKSTVKTSVRTIYRFDLHRERDMYVFHVEGSGFLKQMIRTMMGTLLDVGEGRRDPHSIPSLLEARDRRLAGRTAAAHALCLEAIFYEGEGHDVPPG